MDHVRQLTVPPFESPAKYIIKYIPAIAATVAPEKAEELLRLQRDAKLRLTNSGEWEFNINIKTKEITISRKVAEVFWCTGYAYVVIYQKIFEGRREEEPKTFDLHADEELSKAARLLQWAFESWISDDSSWPSDLPKPLEHPVRESMENVADEIALCAIAYFLHHELAHAYLGHSPSEDGIDQERDADYSAASWLLDGLEETDPRFQKRSLGIALAFAVFTAYGIHTGRFDGRTHPRHFDRLIHVLDRHIRDPEHSTWAVLVAMLKVHLDNAGVHAPTRIAVSFRECVDSYVETLAEEYENGRWSSSR